MWIQPDLNLKKCVQVVLTDSSIEISDCLKSVDYALDSSLSFSKHVNIICRRKKSQYTSVDCDFF